MSTIFVLVGLPGTGKSTLISNLLLDYDPVFVYSTDNYIQDLADSQDKTYNDLFASNIKEATAFMDEQLLSAIKEKKEVIWDQTNLRIKKRRSIISKFPSSWRKECYVIVPPLDNSEVSVWNKRLLSREGKTIPQYVIDSMQSSFEYPTRTEGFDCIKSYDMCGKLVSFL